MVLGFISNNAHTDIEKEKRESEASSQGRVGRSGVPVLCGEVKPRTAPPPTQGCYVWGSEREREKERQMKNDTKCEREIFPIHYIPHRVLYSTSNVTVT